MSPFLPLSMLCVSEGSRHAGAGSDRAAGSCRPCRGLGGVGRAPRCSFHLRSAPSMREVKEHRVDPLGLPSGLLLLPAKGLSGPAQGKTLLWEWGSQLRWAVRLRSLCCDGVPLRVRTARGRCGCCAGLRSRGSCLGSSDEKPVAGAEVRSAAVGQTLTCLRLLP